jgi:hypothetical protein
VLLGPTWSWSRSNCCHPTFYCLLNFSIPTSRSSLLLSKHCYNNKSLTKGYTSVYLDWGPPWEGPLCGPVQTAADNIPHNVLLTWVAQIWNHTIRGPAFRSVLLQNIKRLWSVTWTCRSVQTATLCLIICNKVPSTNSFTCSDSKSYSFLLSSHIIQVFIRLQVLLVPTELVRSNCHQKTYIWLY